MTRPFRVLVVGGTGTFGSRLVRAIGATTDWEVVVAGRDLARTQLFVAECQARTGQERVSGIVLDAQACAPHDIEGTRVDVVVDAAGPFQGSSYTLARASVMAGCHYVDIADGRAFVQGFSTAVDADAQAFGVAAVSGASSTPCLSNAVLDALTKGWTEVDRITVAISPGNRAPRGESVVAAILSYVGRPIRVFRGGAWTTAPGWGLTRRARFPGLGQRFLSLCDTPDLDILPQRFKPRGEAIFLAGLELPLLHLGMCLGGVLVRLGWMQSLRPHARLACRAATLFERFGSDRGGMLVSVSGRDQDGLRASAEWSLLAEGADGPSVPVLPALAYLRRLSYGYVPTPGAAPCVGMIPLADIEAEMVPYRITTRRETCVFTPLFQQALGSSFAALPPVVQALHRPGRRDTWSGRARIEGASSWAGKMASRIFGFPRASEDTSVHVEILAHADTETWVRTFGGKRFRSHLRWPGMNHVFEERFGPFSFRVGLTASATGIGMSVLRWRCGIIPLPTWIMPTSTATESADESGRFVFDVQIDLPLGLGRVVRYTGHLTPDVT